jgi:hypothetical protein
MQKYVVMAGHPGPAFGRPEHMLVPAISLKKSTVLAHLSGITGTSPVMTNGGSAIPLDRNIL